MYIIILAGSQVKVGIIEPTFHKNTEDVYKEKQCKHVYYSTILTCAL